MTSKTGFWVLFKNGDNVVNIVQGKDEYARENGHSKILTAPRAVLKQNYAMFESACGILVYVPIPPLQEDVEENKED